MADYIAVRIRLEDARKFITDAAASSAAVDGFGKSVKVAGEKTEFTRVETFLWRQSLYTLRRELFYGTIALAGLGAGALKVGYDFNEASDKAQAAFTGLLGSARLARVEVDKLVALTHVTGFQLPQLADAATRMLDFGFSVKQTNEQLRAFGIFAQKRNLGVDGIDALTKVFARIQDQGKLTGQSLRQLRTLGVPALQILRRELHLTDAQVQQLSKGKLAIPASVALPALTAGIAATPGTIGLGGLIGIVRSWVGEITGVLEKPLFDWAVGVMPRVNKVLSRGAAGLKAGGIHGLLLGLDPSGRLLSAWRIVVSILEAVVAVLRQVWAIIKVGLPLLGALAAALGFLSHHGTLLRTVLMGLVIWYGYSRTSMLLWRVAAHLAKIDLYELEGATAQMTATQKLFVLWTNRSALATAFFDRWALRASRTMQLLRTAGWLAAAGIQAIWDALLGPVGLVLAAIAIFTVLYFKWKAFHDLVNATARWVKQHWPEVVATLFGGPLTLGILELVRHWTAFENAVVSGAMAIKNAFVGVGQAIVGGIRSALDWLIGGWNRLHFHVPGFKVGPVRFGGFNLGLPQIPLLDTGGSILDTGLAVVHRGETVVPRPARVQPLQPDWLGASGERDLHVHLHIGDREVLETVLKFPQALSDAVFAQQLSQGARA